MAAALGKEGGFVFEKKLYLCVKAFCNLKNKIIIYQFDASDMQLEVRIDEDII